MEISFGSTFWKCHMLHADEVIKQFRQIDYVPKGAVIPVKA